MIYMAAGNSRRFGSNKLFYPIDGKPMYLNGWLQYANGTVTGKLCWSASMKNFWNREEHLPTGQYFHRKAGTVRPGL